MSPTFSPLAPVGDAVFARLQDATLDAMAPGGVHTDVPPDPGYPFVWVEVFEDTQLGGLGTKPGTGALPEIDLRLHVFQSDHGTMRDAQLVMARVLFLFFDDTQPPLAVDGYATCAIFHDRTVPLPDEEINGVKVRELVAMCRLYVEEQ
jgi:hypothetical protein